MRIYTKGKAKYNPLRDIIRKAMHSTKELEWSEDIEIQSAAIVQWARLNKIFGELGDYKV